MSILNVFKKKKEMKLGYYYIVAYHDEAIEHATYFDFMKVIRLMHNDDIVEEETYSYAREKQLTESGNVLLDITKNQLRRATIRQKDEKLLSVLQFERRIR